MKYLHNDALEGLCTEEQLNLLDSIDTLRSQGISHYISLPQIIVCGDQSSGKSSVLEAISGVSFPIKSNLCTRFPTELVLRKHSQPSVRVSIVPHQSRNEAERESLGRFCETLHSFEGLPILIEKAMAAMGISTHGKAFANDLLRVEVSGPDRPHLTIVDLPGLIHSETKQQSAADVQLVQDVVRSYMQEPRSIILAVVSAKNDVANQIVLQLARDVDQAGSRTLGVITKPDTLVPGSANEKMFVSLAENQEVELRLGWHVLKNMDTDRGRCTLTERSAEERQFFEQGVWGDMPRPLVGVDSLRTRLSKLLLSQIAAELPSLMDEIKIKRDTCHEQLYRLGQPRTTQDEQRSYLLQISQSFQSLVKAATDGTYNDPFFDIHSDNGERRRIRAVTQNLNETFTKNISSTGHYRHLSESSDVEAQTESQIYVTRQEYITHIGDLLKKTRGRELPGTFNPMIVKDLFMEQCAPWEEITRGHVQGVWAASRYFLKLVADHIADEATSHALYGEIIIPALDKLGEASNRRTTELLLPHQKGHPITYNHYFTETLQHIRNERREDQICNIIRHFFGVDDLDDPFLPKTPTNLRRLADSLLSHKESDMARFAADEALDCTLAYYKVALKRFIDDVASEVVEITLISSLCDILSPVSVFEMPSELVARIAGESEESSSIREQLVKKLSILNRGLETCRRFVGIRCLDANIGPQPNLSRDQSLSAPVEICGSVTDDIQSISDVSKESDSPSGDVDKDGCYTPEPSVEADGISCPPIHTGTASKPSKKNQNPKR